MKNSSGPQSATSLPRAPRDEVSARSMRYLLTMGIRVACFILMVVVTPYGWYTWLFAIGAVFLPYIAVVGANVGQDSRPARAESPGKALPTVTPGSEQRAADGPLVIRIEEQRGVAGGSEAAASESSDTDGAADEAPDAGRSTSPDAQA